MLIGEFWIYQNNKLNFKIIYCYIFDIYCKRNYYSSYNISAKSFPILIGSCCNVL